MLLTQQLNLTNFQGHYEKMSNIKKWTGGPVTFEDMVINTEWGAFDCERLVLPMTVFDNKVDRESINPRQQIFEKMISGMYLGEVARNCILQLVDRQLLFGGLSSPELNKQWSFETAYMSTMHTDTELHLPETQHILEGILGIPKTTLADRRIVKTVAELVGRRAARLSGCGLAAVLKHCNLVNQECTIAIDGSLFEHFPGFDKNMRQALNELFGQTAADKVKFSLARDGSGLGAAIVAMIAHKAAIAKK